MSGVAGVVDAVEDMRILRVCKVAHDNLRALIRSGGEVRADSRGPADRADEESLMEQTEQTKSP